MAAPFSRRLLVASAVARAWALKTAELKGGESEPQKKQKKRSTQKRFELSRAEKMDFYVSHFLVA